MFVLSQEKLFELDVEQNKEFLYDLVYEIIKENPVLKLNGQFDQLLGPIQTLVDQYLEKGINQINTLKYMVKSHVYLGMDYPTDPQFAWIENEMQPHDIGEQVTYVEAFDKLLEDYKKRVLGQDFNFFLTAIAQLKQNLSQIDHREKFSILYPEKTEFLREKGVFDSLQDHYSNDLQSYSAYVLGNEFDHNIFIKNITHWEV
ncbi:hypothetical protein [Acinetobacter bereziniae]|uniref:hypothetical protein n=1 Tax=Acinetobacter bereziniae TaxID=106648 RepID=UPI00124E6DFA|nr:hypothetical protein [Acinetobacter bereziniae]